MLDEFIVTVGSDSEREGFLMDFGEKGPRRIPEGDSGTKREDGAESEDGTVGEDETEREQFMTEVR
jgi:hypothetical protein